ncbi:MAG: hypothetical protein J6M05_05700 [Cardiobacteriaceae bacterium]|nr:hypothetical protein [Cardiobacteriaceae bacterium]
MQKRLAIVLSAICAGLIYDAAFADNRVQLAEKRLNADPYKSSEVLRELERQQNSFSEDEKRQFNWLRRRFGFFLEDVNTDNELDKPEICLRFNNAVLSEPLQNWASKVQIEPQGQNKLQYRGEELCFLGEYQKTYQIRINSDLTNQYGVKLNNQENREVATGNREPMLRFASNGNLLALNGSRNIGVETSNIDKVAVELWYLPREVLNNENLQQVLLSGRDRYDNLDFEKIGQKLYSGSFNTAQQESNTVKQHNIALSDLSKNGNLHAGFYAIKISNADGYQSDTQVFSLSNTALSAYRSKEGLWVEARNISNLQAVSNLPIKLYARSGALIGTANTDKNGIAKFSAAQIAGKDGNFASYLVADGGSEVLSYLSVEDGEFDLAEKGLAVEGKAANEGALPHWFWSERSTYRPGETINLLALVKNKDLSAINAPLWLQLERPSGNIVEQMAIKPVATGAYSYSYELPETAILGNWQIRLMLGEKGETIGVLPISVDTVMPLTFEAKGEAVGKLEAQKAGEYKLKTSWLYGGAASNIHIDGNYSFELRPADAFKNYAGWTIGRYDEKLEAESVAIDGIATDKNGQADLQVQASPFSSNPLQLNIRAQMRPEAGRELLFIQKEPIVRSEPYVALKANGDTVQVALLDDNGKEQGGNLKWQLFDVKYHGYWYRDYSGWHYKNDITKIPSGSGNVSVSGKAATVKINRKNPYDTQILEVTGQTPAVAGSVVIGNQPNGDIANPDAIRFSEDINQKEFKAGDTVKVRLLAPFDGKATVSLAQEGILETHNLEFRQGAADFSFKYKDGWERGIWLLANAYNSDQTGAHNRRAVGMLYVAGNADNKSLPVTAKLPKEIKPGEELDLEFALGGADKNAFINVAIVDEGLYRIGRKAFSSPLKGFYGKYLPGFEFFDSWGRVIREIGADKANLRQGAGGDEEFDIGMEDLIAIDMSEFVRFWSKPIPVEAGKARVKYRVPEHFNGKLRLMAAAFSADKVGALEEEIIVKAPVVAELRTPLYLSPEDSSNWLLRLANSSDKTQSVKVEIAANGAGKIDLPQKSFTENLNAGEEKNIKIPFTANAAGEVEITAKVEAAGETRNIKRKITVRNQTLPEREIRYEKIAANQEANISVAANAVLSVVAALPYSQEVLAENLDEYQYSCAEQLASRIYGNNFLLSGDSSKADKAVNLYNALLNRQTYDNGFAAWGSDDSSNLWLSAYVGEVLLSEKYRELINQDGSPQQRLAKYLREQVSSSSMPEDKQLAGIAYAHLVIAKSGEDARGALMRLTDALPDRLPLNADSVNFALAYAIYGDRDRSFEILKRIDATKSGADNGRSYASNTARDGELLTRLYEWQKAVPDKANSVNAWINGVSKRLSSKPKKYLSTNENAWLLRASEYTAKPQNLQFNGENKAKYLAKQAETVKVKNTRSEEQTILVSELKYPAATDKYSNGWTISRSFYRLKDGTEIQSPSFNLYDDIVVRITATPSYEFADAMLIYPLPAGVSANNLGELSESFKERNAWAKNLTNTVFAQTRDDRHIAVFDRKNEDGKIEYAFVIKAVNSGSWNAPGYRIEDMYQPENMAREPAYKTTIK